MNKNITLNDVKKLRLFKYDEYDKFKIELDFNGEINEYELKVSRQYNFLEFNLKTLEKLSKLFDTQRINVNKWMENGCETCDFGSCYELIFNIREENENDYI